MSLLPTELLYQITDNLSDEPAILGNCSLAHSIFRDPCQRRLFARPSFGFALGGPGFSCNTAQSFSLSCDDDPSASIDRRLRDESDSAVTTFCHDGEDSPSDEDLISKPSESFKKFHHALLRNPRGGRLCTFVKHLSMYFHPVDPVVFDTEDAEDDYYTLWAMATFSQLQEILLRLPGLRGCAIISQQQGLLPEDPTIASGSEPLLMVLDNIISPAFDTLSLTGLKGQIPPRIMYQLKHLSLDRAPAWIDNDHSDADADADSPQRRRPLPLITLSQFTADHGSRRSLLSRFPRDRFPDLEKLSIYCPSEPPDAWPARLIAANPRCAWHIPLSTHYGIPDPLPLWNNMDFPDTMTRLVFDVDMTREEGTLPHILPKRISDIVTAFTQWQLQNVNLGELHLVFRFHHSPSEGFDITSLAWPRLKEAIGLAFANERLGVAKLRFVHILKDSQRAHQERRELEKFRRVALDYFEDLFTPQTIRRQFGFGFEIEYDLV